MGFEDFRVELHGGRTSYVMADEIIRKLPHAKLDPNGGLPVRGATYYLYDDGQHAIGLALDDTPVRLSCRFMLCHPPSVDAAFLEIVRDLMTRLGMWVAVCDEVSREHACSFSLDDFAHFSAAALGTIAARRAEWIKAFGDESILSATTKEVFERFILPRCQPVTQQTE